ncbi:DUF3180 domain-containing protein [Amnibacterium kyonggiense]|uniref:Uncharacterized protein DUF3180 n=1 Tax=Amnibacterium kyonggiense TaxID=595671 RepID=A0A4R7FQX1_9MICO|nr:DUF3180 domain-containing protein [Amnibacterium kyonggiense]TDS80019.1 uncharacterized protein DUF3180 [Amnibacterium kyonggiense]
MRRTSPVALVGIAIAGGVIGWLLQVALAAGGTPSYQPPATLYSVLFILAFGLILLGRPVRRLVRGTANRPVDPFYAMRVLVLAKASSLAGALLVGVAVAFLGYAVSRTGSFAVPAFWPDLLTGVGALALCAAGLVVEWWCRIPPQDPADRPDRTLEQR